MARSFSQEARSDSHKIGETRYRMSHIIPSGTIARTLLLAGILLAVTVLASQSFFPAFAQEADEPVEVEYAENGDDPVVAFTATDPEGDTITWDVTGTDADTFSVTDGVLTFKKEPNFEAPTDIVGTSPSTAAADDNVYEVTVQAEDDGNPQETTEKMVIVTVTNVEEPGTITMTGVQPKEGIALTATLTDPDGRTVGDTLPLSQADVNLSGDPTKWQWASATSTGQSPPDRNSERWKDIKNATTTSYMPTEDDVGSYLRVMATYMDGKGEDDPDTFEVDESLEKEIFTFDRMVLMADYTNMEPEFQDPDGDPLTETTRSVAENSVAGTVVGKPVVATDPGEDGMQEVLTYTLEGTDESSFTIVTETQGSDKAGQIKVGATTMLNREAKDSYSVTVKATDPSGLMDTIPVTINITDVDEDPTITDTTGGDAIIIPENTAATRVLHDYVATDLEDDAAEPQKPLKWSLARGGDSGRFDIDSDAGQLRFKESPNFETGGDNEFNVTVVVTDSGDHTDTRAVVITVTDVDEADNPVILLSNRQAMIGTQITATLRDPDKPKNIVWTWATSSDPIQQGSSNRFTPRNGTRLTVSVTYTDSIGDKTSVPAATAAILERPAQNNRPTAAITAATRPVPENAAAGAFVGELIDITEPDESDGGQLLTYTLSGGGDNFTINRETGQIQVAEGANLDRETTSSYTVRVRGTDPGGLHAEVSVTINVTDIAEGPDITRGDTSIDYNEKDTGEVETYTATDPEDDKARKSLKWSVSVDTGTANADRALFKIGEGNGKLEFMDPPDYESPADDGENNVYNVTVVVTDSTTDTTNPTGRTADQEVTITVKDVEETGTITLPTLQPKEGVEIQAKLIDPDGGRTASGPDEVPLTIDVSEDQTDLTDDETTKWQWARSANKTNWTDIEKMATSSSYTPVKEDVGSYLRVTATYLDRRSENAEDVKAPPTFTISANKVQAKDYQNAPPKFPDQDPNLADDQTDQKRKVAENSPMGTRVGAPVVATDLDRSGNQEPLIYKLYGAGVTDTNAADAVEGGGDARVFAIDNNGQITVATTTLDHDNPADVFTRGGDDAKEADDSVYEVQVKAIDPSAVSTTINVTIRVTNVDEAPKLAKATETEGLAATKKEEKSASSTALSTYRANDDEDYADTDTDTTLKWSLSGPDKDMFEINATTTPTDCSGDDVNKCADLTFKKSPNFEARADAGGNNVYNVTVVATDSDDMAVSRDVAVTVTNVEEDGIVTLDRVQPEVGSAITATLSDPDGGESGVTWQWQSQAAASRDALNDLDTDWTDIRGATSRAYTPVADDVGTGIFLRASATYTDSFMPQDDPDSPNIDESQQKEGASFVSYHDVLATVDGNRPPAFGDQDPDTPGTQDTQATRRVNENVPAGTSIGKPITAVDNDPGNLTYTLEGSDAPLFEIGVVDDGTTTEVDEVGLISVGEGTKLDYETRTSYRVTVRATDPAGASDTIAVTIEVIPLNEEPKISTKGLVVSGDRSVSYAEDRTGAVATYTAVGSDANGASWNLAGADASAFSIAGGTLSFNRQPNFENPTDSGTDNVYNVTVRASGGTISASKDVAVTVTNVDEDGTATITPSGQPRVGVELTASVTDVDGTPTAISWQWSRSTSNTGGWSNIAAGRQANYTPTVADEDNYLRATASYTDPQGSGKIESAVTSAVVLAASTEGTPGTVALTPSTQLTSGDSVTATLTDADNPVNQAWRWARSSTASGTFTNIPNATSASYTTTDADAGNYLRATVTYTDDSGTGKTADASTSSAVKLHTYDANASGRIERSEVIEAIRDFLFHRTITRDQVIQVIRLYLTR